MSIFLDENSTGEIQFISFYRYAHIPTHTLINTHLYSLINSLSMLNNLIIYA